MEIQIGIKNIVTATKVNENTTSKLVLSYIRYCNYHATNLLLELPSLKARKTLVTAGRLGWEVEL